MLPIDDGLLQRLHHLASADRWRVSPARLAAALSDSLERAFPGQRPTPSDIERYARSLHLEDLALACACADGDEAAWEHFVREVRPALSRAAAALDPSGGARDLADSIYGDLFGVPGRGAERQSLFRYFHGRSRLVTWLRAVLSQRWIDRLRANQRVVPLPEDESPAALASTVPTADPERSRDVAAMERALQHAIADLEPGDRLRLRCYYAQGMTLAEIGLMLREHEATASRHLARTRGVLRTAVERRLREDAGLSDEQIRQCIASVTADAGPMDLGVLLRADHGRKESARIRSKEEEAS